MVINFIVKLFACCPDLSAFTTTTKSPVSTFGVTQPCFYCAGTTAIFTASLPRTASLASTRYHLYSISVFLQTWFSFTHLPLMFFKTSFLKVQSAWTERIRHINRNAYKLSIFLQMEVSLHKESGLKLLWEFDF